MGLETLGNQTRRHLHLSAVAMLRVQGLGFRAKGSGFRFAVRSTAWPRKEKQALTDLDGGEANQVPSHDQTILGTLHGFQNKEGV